MTQDDPKPNLELVATGDLIAEIFKRVDAAVFVGMKMETNNAYKTFRRWIGPQAFCTGLSLNMALDLRKLNPDKVVEVSEDWDDF